MDDLVDGGDKAVRAQYEAYPYPARDPADEAHRLITGSPSHILEIEHFVLRGGRAGDLRALVAGGGTGDGAIMLVQQLADRGTGSVTYLDMSSALWPLPRGGPGPAVWRISPFIKALCWICPAWVGGPSTTSIVAACCITWLIRRRGWPPW